MGSGVLRVWSHSPDAGPAREGGGRQVGTGSPAAADGESAISHYPASEGVSSTQLASLVRAARGVLAEIGDALPARLRHANRLPDRAAARWTRCTSPSTRSERELGRARLAFEELLLGQLLLLRRRASAARARAPSCSASQRRAQRALDRRRGCRSRSPRISARRRARSTPISPAARPMQRLLIGEVGSGKTVVALYAILRAFEHGLRAC